MRWYILSEIWRHNVMSLFIGWCLVLRRWHRLTLVNNKMFWKEKCENCIRMGITVLKIVIWGGKSSVFLWSHNARLARLVRNKSGKFDFSSGSGKSQGILQIGQGNFKYQESREKSGNFIILVQNMCWSRYFDYLKCKKSVDFFSCSLEAVKTCLF